jgi:hypothetical protein
MALSITLNTLAWGEMLMVPPLAGESVMVRPPLWWAAS